MKRIYFYIIAFTMAILTGCRGTKDATTSGASSVAIKTEAIKQRIADHRLDVPAVTAKMKVHLDAFGQDRPLNGSLRMKRDEVVRLSISVLGMEVGRMEFTPEDVLIVDRFNKQYARFRYDEAEFLKLAGIDFYMLQAIFWNELFIPGERQIDKQQLDRFYVKRSDDNITLMLKGTQHLAYDFLANASTALISSITMRDASGEAPVRLVFSYDDFEKFEGKKFPTQVAINLEGIGKPTGIMFSLSNLGTATDWDTHTKLSSKYKQLTAADLAVLAGKLLKK